MACKLTIVPYTYPITLETPLCKLLFIAGDADELVVTGDEALVADWLLAHIATKAFFMPLLATELKLLHACKETSISNCYSSSSHYYKYIHSLQTCSTVDIPKCPPPP